MKKLAVWLIAVGALTTGCSGYRAADRDHDHAPQKQHEPVDRNRNSVPDSLERKAVPLEPIVDRATEPAS